MAAVRDYAGARRAWSSASATASRSSARRGCCPGALIRNTSLEYRCMTCELRGRGQHGRPSNPATLGARLRAADRPRRGQLPDRRGRASRRLEANRPDRSCAYVRTTPTARWATSPASATRRGNVFGMMPHPDRGFERFHPSQDGLAVARAVLATKFPEFLRRLTRRRPHDLMPPRSRPTRTRSSTSRSPRSWSGSTACCRRNSSRSERTWAATPTLTELGHLLGDVVGALLLQEHAAAAQGLSRPRSAAPRARSAGCS